MTSYIIRAMSCVGVDEVLSEYPKLQDVSQITYTLGDWGDVTIKTDDSLEATLDFLVELTNIESFVVTRVSKKVFCIDIFDRLVE